MEKPTQIMMQLIKGEVCGEPAEIAPSLLSEAILEKLYCISKLHDLAHLVGNALDRQGLLPSGELGEKFQKQSFTAAFRYQRLQFSYEQICKALDEVAIPYVPLKGSVIRAYYAEPWMRTSCDIDVLIRREDMDRAIQTLSEKIGFTKEPHKNARDISLYLVGNTHLELHYNITENIASMDRVLLTVWDHTARAEDNRQMYLQSNEFLLFHLLAHAAYHFVSGGCGVRPILDLWLLRKRLTIDQSKLDALLQKADLKAFEIGLTSLSNVWFENEAHTPLTQEMENYILGAGVYGTLESKVALQSTESQGRFRYFLYRVFRPYRLLKKSYPKLEKYPILYPYYTVVRWCRVWRNNRRKAMKEIRYTASVSTDQTQRLSEMCHALKLKKE